MRRFLSLLLTGVMAASLFQVNFSAASDQVTVTAKGQNGYFTITDTTTSTDSGVTIPAMSINDGGNEVSVYPIINIGSAGTYNRTTLPQGMNSKEVKRLITYAQTKGFSQINAEAGLSGDQMLTSNDDLDIAITAAIWQQWRYNMGDKQMNPNKNQNKYLKAAQHIVRNFSSYQIPDTTFDINSSNIKTLAHNDDSYRYYGPFTFTSNNASLASAEINTASVKIANSNWRVVDNNSLTAGTNYYVAVPNDNKAEDIQVKLSLQYVDKELVTYGNSFNSFVGVLNTPFLKNETLTINSYSSAKIYSVAGTVVNVKSDDGIYDRNITIGTNGVGYADNLTIGSYTAKEITAPSGFVVNTTPRTFTITGTNQIVEVNFESINYMGTLQVENKSSDGNILTGSTVKVYRQDGTLVQTLHVSELTSIELPIGEYYAVQTEAVPSYMLNNTKTNFTIKANELTKITIVNYLNGNGGNNNNGNNNNNSNNGNNNSNNNINISNPMSNGYVRIVAVNELNQVIPGLSFTLKRNSSSYSETLYTDSNGMAIFKPFVTASDLTLTYNRNGQNIYMELSPVSLSSNSYGYSTVKIVMKRKTPNISTSNKYPSVTTDKYIDQFNTGVGNSTSHNIYTGSYNNDATWTSEDNFTVFDSENNGRLKVVVRDPDGKKMKGVTIYLYNSKDKKVATATTDKDGEVRLQGLESKKEYRIDFKESTLDDYYAPEEERLTFKSKSDDGTYKLTVDLLEDNSNTSNESNTSPDFSATVTGKTNIAITTRNNEGKDIYAEYTIYDASGKEIISGKPENNVVTFSTDVTGNYTLKQTKVADGYKLETEPYAFTVTSTAKNIPLTIVNEVKLATLTGRVFEDKNGNNVYDKGEEYKAAKLTVSNGEKSITVYSGATGEFVVTELPNGTYTVSAEKINGITFVTPNVGNDKAIDSDVNSNGEGTIIVKDTDITDFGVGFKVSTSTSNEAQTSISVNGNGSSSNNGGGTATRLPKTGDTTTHNIFYLSVAFSCLLGLILINRKSKKA